MAATMNPTDLYRDPTMNDTTVHASRSRQNGGTGRSAAEQDWRISQKNHSGPESSSQTNEGVQIAGPPISYRGVSLNPDPNVHRSFSQRSKPRPVTGDIYSAGGHVYERSIDRSQRLNGRSSSATGPSDNSNLINTPSADLPSGSKPHRGSNSTSRSKPNIPMEYETSRAAERLTPGRPSTTKDSKIPQDDQGENWASDRSPLQTLEVKLADISKEEKRARVQEAEMRLRDDQAAQAVGTAQTQTRRPLRTVSQPEPRSKPVDQASIRPAALQNEANTSARIGRNDAAQATGRGDRGTRQMPPVDIPSRQHRLISQEASTYDSGRGSDRQIPPNPPTEASINSARLGPTGANNGMLPVDTIQQSQLPRPVAKGQKRVSESSRGSERPISERERIASHQAALQQLTGQGPPPPIQQTPGGDNRRSKMVSGKTSRATRPTSEIDSPIAVDIGTLAGDSQRPAYVTSRSSQPNTMSSAPTAPPSTMQSGVGLGTKVATPARSTSLQNGDVSKSTKNKDRKSSVSFQEPFDTRRPVDEWKSADCAQLVAEDFSTEEMKRPEAYKPWWEQEKTTKSSRTRISDANRALPMHINDETASFDPPLHLKCGPLLRYVGLRRSEDNANGMTAVKEFWRGTIMIVTQDSKCSYREIPTLRVFSQPKKLLPPPPALVTGDQLAPEYIDPIAGLTKLSRTGRAVYVRPVDHLEEGKDLSRLEDDTGIYEASPSPLDVHGTKTATAAASNKRTLDTDGEMLGRCKEVKGIRIYADPDRDVTFWRFSIEVELGLEQQHIAYRINKGAAIGFWVPARGKTMNIMFHSCNGFSMSVDPNVFSGPDPLWRDVLNNHQTRPFHVMIGGGDQIYNDRVMADTQLFSEWTHIRNPHHKHQAPFTLEMRNELESFYLERYAMWFSQGLFGMANASIPMVNIWDDHDIIDGYGSYPDDFMKSPVFTGVGEIAHKYYLLFQHHTIDAMTEKDEPSWILGTKPGPYIHHVSRSVYLELGQHVGFLGVDARTERSRHDVISIDTLEIILERCRREMVEGQTKHLIVLLGVPIAYPRLVWLESLLTSKALDPLKALHRAGIVKTKLLNKFDGGVEILDDLDDHWTATHHKVERNILIQELQDLAAEKSARVTILSGDVHLAAIGQFYSNPKLKIPKDRDHRYMPNVISSAIVNTPPSSMVADVLNKRNKVHHLDKYTDENMIPMFTHDVDDKRRNNTHLLPRRNWCSIREFTPGETPPLSRSTSPSTDGGHASIASDVENQHPDGEVHNPKRRLSFTKADFNPRGLMRRFSSRGEPPNSFQNRGPGSGQLRSASYDGTGQPSMPFKQSPQLRSSSADHVPDVPALRPTFHRRPTNLAEKAARKGNVVAIDDQGNEIDFNDNINLEGGLDIVLNCEVNQRDPAGITAQYRLLVPALWYDGSSDRQKITAAAGPNRANALLKRFGLNARRNNEDTSPNRKEENFEDYSDSGSYSGSEANDTEPVSKKKFSLFGNRRRKDIPPSDTEQPPILQQNAGNIQSVRQEASMPESSSNFRNVATQSTTPTRPTIPTSSQGSSSSQQPRVTQQTQTSAQQLPARDSSQRIPQQLPRPLSYVIGSSGAESQPPLGKSHANVPAPQRSLYDPDAAYISSQHQRDSVPIQRSASSGQNGPRQSTIPDSAAGGDYIPTQSRQLRGNGIIGKNIPPTSYHHSNSSIGQHYDNPPRENLLQQQQRRSSSAQRPESSRGYSGIEAYKEPKPRRRWSLREKARNMLDNFEAKRRYRQDEWSSEGEEGEEGEGQDTTHSGQFQNRQQHQEPSVNNSQRGQYIPSRHDQFTQQMQRQQQTQSRPPPPPQAYSYPQQQQQQQQRQQLQNRMPSQRRPQLVEQHTSTRWY